MPSKAKGTAKRSAKRSKAVVKPKRGEADVRKLLHELEVRETELRLQNDELLLARAQTEVALQRYSELFDWAPVGCARLDALGNIQEINHAGAEVLRRERVQLLARRFQAFIQPRDLAAFDFLRARGASIGKQQRCEITLDVEGGPRLVRVTMSAIGDDRRSTLVAFEDVTDQRLREEALARSERALRSAEQRKNEFIAMLSHELRNPLAPIHLGLRILSRSEGSIDQSHKAVAIIERQVQHLTRLIDDLLDVTRMGHGKIRLQRKSVELGDLVRQALEDSLENLRNHEIRTKLTVENRLLWVDADPVRLVQVVSNLLGNAAKFTPPGGLVTLTLGTEGEMGVLRVSDTGAGIAPEVLPSLFEPFSQAPQTMDRAGGGLGLGLAMVKGLVELHGGRVRVHSGGLGQGAEFVVELPLTSPAGELPETPVARPVRTFRILLIEDNVDFAEMLKEELAANRHEVRVAAEGKEGIDVALEFKPEVVFCDLGLPGMNGYAVARAFRQDARLRDTFLVALTGYAQPSAVQSAAEAGFNRHLAKPPSEDSLNSVLAEVPFRSLRRDPLVGLLN